jgi:FkbM family methyltransferase
MSTVCRVASSATDLACRIIGRRQVVRSARFLLYRARLDIAVNSERSLQRWMADLAFAGQPAHVMDMGASVGHWSGRMLVTARQAGRLSDLDLHAFEPSSYTLACLLEALEGRPVQPHRVALCERSGSAALHVVAPAVGVNSHAPTMHLPGMSTEEVSTTTLDEYAAWADIDQITLLKIATKGQDLAVIRGARILLTERRIRPALFEYNHWRIATRSFLRDAFELLTPLGIRVGKLTSHGVGVLPRLGSRPREVPRRQLRRPVASSRVVEIR